MKSPERLLVVLVSACLSPVSGPLAQRSRGEADNGNQIIRFGEFVVADRTAAVLVPDILHDHRAR
jgi:hypothetical protein